MHGVYTGKTAVCRKEDRPIGIGSADGQEDAAFSTFYRHIKRGK